MTTPTSAFPSTAAPDPRRWKALTVLALVQFMLILDVTVVNVALPSIQKDLHFSRAGLAWVVDGYVLMAGGFLLLGGRLSDLVGRRRLFLIGTALFGAASALCGAAVSSGMLVASRFAQGLGEALAAPAALGLVALLFPDPKERTKALGIWGGIAGLGGTTGTIISGALTNIGHGTWRLIFYVNVPVALFAVAVLPRLTGESRAAQTVRGQRPDILGAVTATAGLSGIVYGFLRAGEVPWGSPSVVAALAGGVALLALFVVVEANVGNPLVPLRFFQNRTRVTTNAVTLFFASAFFTYFYLQTLYLQQVLHYSPLKAGLSYLPFGIVISLAIGVGTALLPKIGVKAIMSVGFGMSAVAMILLTRITVQGSYTSQVLPPMLILAFGAGLCFPGFGNASLHQVSQEDASLASGVQNAVQNIGGAVGLAVLATVATRHIGAAHFGTSEYYSRAVDGYSNAFLTGGVILAIGAVLVALFLEQVHVVADPIGQPGAELSSTSSSTAGEVAAVPAS